MSFSMKSSTKGKYKGNKTYLAWNVEGEFANPFTLFENYFINVAFEFFNVVIFHQFSSYKKTDLSGNTARPQKTHPNRTFFFAFLLNFCSLKM